MTPSHDVDALRVGRRHHRARNLAIALAAASVAWLAAGCVGCMVLPLGGTAFGWLVTLEGLAFPACVLSVVLLPARLRRGAPLRLCSRASVPCAVRVASDRTRVSDGLRLLDLVDDDVDGREFSWGLAPELGVPIFVGFSPPRILAVRAASDPRVVVPVASSGDPFEMRSEQRLAMIRAVAPPLQEQVDAALHRVPQFGEMRATTGQAGTEFARFAFVALGAVAALGVAFLPSPPARLFGGIVAVVMLPFAVLCFRDWRWAAQCVRVEPDGIHRGDRRDGRRHPWGDVGQITVRPRHVAAERAQNARGALLLLGVHGAVKYAMDGRHVTPTWVGRVTPVGDELDRRLRAIGSARPDEVLPDVEIRDAAGRRIARFRGTHDWRTVESLLRTAAAHGVELQVG